MKKLILAAIFGALFVVSCSKKNEHPLQDSNIMLEEPEVQVVDSAAPKVDSATAAAPAPSAVKVDSTTAQK